MKTKSRFLNQLKLQDQQANLGRLEAEDKEYKKQLMNKQTLMTEKCKNLRMSKDILSQMVIKQTALNASLYLPAALEEKRPLNDKYLK